MLLTLAVLLPLPCGGSPEILEVRTVYESDEDTNFPFAGIMPCGDWRMNFSVGQHTVTERGMTVRSTDGGKTWEECSGPGGFNCVALDPKHVIAFGYAPTPDPWVAVTPRSSPSAAGGCGISTASPGFVAKN